MGPNEFQSRSPVGFPTFAPARSRGVGPRLARSLGELAPVHLAHAQPTSTTPLIAHFVATLLAHSYWSSTNRWGNPTLNRKDMAQTSPSMGLRDLRFMSEIFDNLGTPAYNAADAGSPKRSEPVPGKTRRPPVAKRWVAVHSRLRTSRCRADSFRSSCVAAEFHL